jgi:hypothetical protein
MLIYILFERKKGQSKILNPLITNDGPDHHSLFQTFLDEKKSESSLSKMKACGVKSFGGVTMKMKVL